MRGTILPFPNTPSWRGAQLKKAHVQLYLLHNNEYLVYNRISFITQYRWMNTFWTTDVRRFWIFLLNAEFRTILEAYQASSKNVTGNIDGRSLKLSTNVHLLHVLTALSLRTGEYRSIFVTLMLCRLYFFDIQLMFPQNESQNIYTAQIISGIRIKEH
jgi:hypothetical protein